MKSATWLRTAANGCSARSESTASFASTLFSLARIASTLFEFLQRRIGAADHFVQIAAATGEAGAELVEDDREALALGQSRDVAEQVDVDRACVFCTGSRYWPLPSRPLAIFFSGGASGVPATRGCVGRQSTNFSPISACGRIVQLASARKSLKPAFEMFSTTAAFACGVGVTEADGADLDAADLDVLAGDDVAGVVEDRAHGVAAVGAARRGRQQHGRCERGHAEERRDRGSASPPPDGLRPHPVPSLTSINKAGGPTASMKPPVSSHCRRFYAPRGARSPS